MCCRACISALRPAPCSPQLTSFTLAQANSRKQDDMRRILTIVSQLLGLKTMMPKEAYNALVRQAGAAPEVGAATQGAAIVAK